MHMDVSWLLEQPGHNGHLEHWLVLLESPNLPLIRARGAQTLWDIPAKRVPIFSKGLFLSEKSRGLASSLTRSGMQWRKDEQDFIHELDEWNSCVLNGCKCLFIVITWLCFALVMAWCRILASCCCCWWVRSSIHFLHAHASLCIPCHCGVRPWEQYWQVLVSFGSCSHCVCALSSHHPIIFLCALRSCQVSSEAWAMRCEQRDVSNKV